MEHLFLLFYFIFGTIIGSFLNVVILRHNTGRSISGRSACAHCQARLGWFELVPIFSWVWHRGRCRYCGSAISVQYPLVEILTGVLFSLGAFIDLNVIPLFIYFCIVSVLISITVYDIKHTIIPDGWVYLFSILALLFVVSTGQVTTFSDFLLRVGSGLSLSAPFAFLWFISKGRWMGLGDAKLIIGIGVLLGLSQGFFSVMISFVVGALVGVLLLFLSSERLKTFVRNFTPTLASKRLMEGFTMKSEIPFGPFLIGVSFVVWTLNLKGINIHLDMINVALVSLSSWL